MTSIRAEDEARPEGSDSQPGDARHVPKTLSPALAASFRAGGATYVADSILDEGGIRALAEAADLLEIEP